MRAEHTILNILEGGLFTGSRAFCVETDKSDYDYGLCVQDYYRFITELKFLNIGFSDSTYKRGIFFKLGGKLYNVFCLPAGEMDAWEYATKTIIAMAENEDLKSKIKRKTHRVALFETLVLFYRFSI